MGRRVDMTGDIAEEEGMACGSITGCPDRPHFLLLGLENKIRMENMLRLFHY